MNGSSEQGINIMFKHVKITDTTSKHKQNPEKKSIEKHHSIIVKLWKTVYKHH